MKTTNLQSPWRVIVSQHSNKKPSAWEIITKYGGVIAETNNLTNDTIPRLIAAAPDMLDALQRIESSLEHEPEIYSDILSVARAAIAKATGKQ